MSLAAGDRLGPYQIVAQLGAGGMGEVYRARDSRLERDVAVKVLPQHLAQNPQALTRFVRETKALAALSHPSLLAIFDTGSENGIAFAVTELLDGESLRSMLSGRGALPWRKAAEIAAMFADGLAAAHSKGVTHRDVKPDNLFLTTSGHAKILDFGLARVEPAGEAAPDPETLEPGLTQAGIVLGTPGYLSPEQVHGTPAGPVSDIFSLGCVLYEMISGKRAFPNQSMMGMMTSILRDTPPDLASLAPGVPSELTRLVNQCLEKSPQRRLQSAQDLAAQLRAILSAQTQTNTASGTAAAVIDSIAVLPFTNSNNDAENEYLSDGITENILNSLAQLGRLRVIPRSTVFRYKGSQLDPQAIGRELGVRVVLTGRVIQRGETLVVGTELLDVSAGSQLWGERYNRKISDIFALEEEIARKISDSLRVKLSGDDKSRLAKRVTENTEAYQLYLKGRHHWMKRTPDHLAKSADYFQQAIDKDPSFALAYSGLADCYSLLGAYSSLPQREAWARAKAAAVAAVAFDDESAEAHTSLAFVRAFFDWDWNASDKEFRRALELNSGYWVASYWYAMMLCSVKRFDEAEAQIRHGMELEPLSPVMAHCFAMVAHMAGRHEEAIERSLRAIDINPDFFLLRWWLGCAYQCQGKFDNAIAELEKAVAMCDGKISWIVGSLGAAHACAGHRAEALRILEQLKERTQREVVDPTAMIYLYTALGDIDNALAWAERGVTDRGMLPVVIQDQRFDPLRPDPRFQAVLRRMNLA
jgi:serine/threonine protein kinase/tetratricopeptide (TPR) repeat protein